MDPVVIDHPIIVGAVFEGGLVRPKWFLWKGRRYAIAETTYRWQDRRGESVIAHFSVSDGASLFEISLDHKTLRWRLERALGSVMEAPCVAESGH